MITFSYLKVTLRDRSINRDVENREIAFEAGKLHTYLVSKFESLAVLSPVPSRYSGYS
ncbi:MAG: hypothetical protein VKN72_09360 [Nostocales cyanobacterium 94392]|nr:hypothetical protein [Nostocales cyanobacterium 94392]